LGYSPVSPADVAFTKQLFGEDNVSTERTELVANASDAFPGEWYLPELVVWPETTDEVSKLVAYANGHRIPITPRGAGSSLAGNVVPVNRGIVVNLRRMNKILHVVKEDHQAIVQPGVVYDQLNESLSGDGLFFPPDPGSSSVCTIGGMVGNNASGLRAVKYGVTRNYVLGLEIVLTSGEVIRTGSRAIKSSNGYDLLDLFVGSEGTLGVVTEIILRLKPKPAATLAARAGFGISEDSTRAVSKIIEKGLLPSAIEFMDRETIRAVNRRASLNLKETAAMLLLETDGTPLSAEHEMNSIREICLENNAESFELASDDSERRKLWAVRKSAYPSLVKSALSPIIGDVVVPISKITELVQCAYVAAEKHNVRIACFGHSGDGNVHPVILSDRSDKDLWERSLAANNEIVHRAIEMGGVSSGEHGVGLEKREFMEFEHGPAFRVMRQVKDLLDPNGIMNPGKIFT
jgi:glycolate oxidase subunit GlcD